jgi:hypothetical protein
MSEIRLVIRDAARDINGIPESGFVEAVVAALSAEPETIAELETAIERFQKPRESAFFDSFDSGINMDPGDEGLVIIDLAGRLLAHEASAFEPRRDGSVLYHDGESLTDLGAPYHLPEDWVFVTPIAGWHSQAEARRRERAANPPLDARAVLYGRPLLEFIAAECFKAPAAVPEPAPEKPVAADATDNPTGDLDALAYEFPPRDEAEYAIVRDIHVRWMMTPRDELRGQTPREVLHARRKFLGRDMDARVHQWSSMDFCPRGLDSDAFAFRFAGFGTHEHVMYYELVRHLLSACRDRQRDAASSPTSPAAAFRTTGDFMATEVPVLERLRDEWLDTPQLEHHGRTARSIIDRERARLPEGMSGHEAMIDHDCPMCQMMADMPGPVFWHLDGCNMDDDFAFSLFCDTREEWDKEQREYAEFHRKCEEREAERKRLGVDKAPGGGWDHPDSVWRRSFVSNEAPDFPAMRLFAIGSNLAELVVDLKEPTENRPLIDQLSRDFGNLREVSGSAESASALVEPVINRFCETLDAVAAARSDLEEKCCDLQMRLSRFLEPPREADPDDDSDVNFDGSDDVPF